MSFSGQGQDAVLKSLTMPKQTMKAKISKLEKERLEQEQQLSQSSKKLSKLTTKLEKALRDSDEQLRKSQEEIARLKKELERVKFYARTAQGGGKVLSIYRPS